MKKLLNYFTKIEWILWCSSITLIVGSFCIFDSSNPLSLIASLIGVTSIIFSAKGNPFGPFLMILFSSLYGYISYTFSYYGEMITYLGMTMPMAVIALISWLRHPYKGKKSEVEINLIGKKETILMFIASGIVTVLFYFILAALDTANLAPSTLSVTTSFLAVYLTFRRNPYFSVAYACNDIILVILWVLASLEDVKYLSVVICFVAFLFNDIYAFINWKSMAKKQNL
ncbi:MAG: nicotinamide riboside transporter PnuC [Lachnospiraceae bacterium]|nr:nicotinamide riboside transporter PnuC [Lachnospiraceae bacterium]